MLASTVIIFILHDFNQSSTETRMFAEAFFTLPDRLNFAVLCSVLIRGLYQYTCKSKTEKLSGY